MKEDDAFRGTSMNGIQLLTFPGYCSRSSDMCLKVFRHFRNACGILSSCRVSQLYEAIDFQICLHSNSLHSNNVQISHTHISNIRHSLSSQASIQKTRQTVHV